MSDALSFDSVSFSYNGERVVDNVSFSIAEGEIVCLLGPSVAVRPRACDWQRAWESLMTAR